jgi:hypothetical protein
MGTYLVHMSPCAHIKSDPSISDLTLLGRSEDMRLSTKIPGHVGGQQGEVFFLRYVNSVIS